MDATKRGTDFVPRLTRPESGNPYYNTRARGGYSFAIQGNPVDPGCDVLHNCVGYAYGRFNEIAGEGCCKYLSPVNAERFMQYTGGLETGATPRLGACMVWQKGDTLDGSDGAGHVAIVEKIITPYEIVTSESGWGSKQPFWTQTRRRGEGRWGMGAGYKFLGFIYNPAVSSTAPASQPEPVAENTTPTVKKEALRELPKPGTLVEFTGTRHYSNAYAAGGPACKPGKALVTALYPAGTHPIHLKAIPGEGSNVHGWVDAADVAGLESKSQETTVHESESHAQSEAWTPAVGDVVEFSGNLHYLNAYAARGSSCTPGRARISSIFQPGKAPHPYHLIREQGGGSNVYGWVDPDTFQKV